AKADDTAVRASSTSRSAGSEGRSEGAWRRGARIYLVLPVGADQGSELPHRTFREDSQPGNVPAWCMFKDDLLKDKVIFVSGGGSGLGLSMSRRFLELGAKVVIASRRLELLEESSVSLREATGGEVLPVRLDVRDPAQVAAA